MPIPLLSRLSWEDYKRLSLAIFILLVEGLLRFTTWLMPLFVRDLFRNRFLQLFPQKTFKGQDGNSNKVQQDPLYEALTTPELIKFHGYRCEEHLVLTADGYILLLHRILPKLITENNGIESSIQDEHSRLEGSNDSGRHDLGFPSPEPSVILPNHSKAAPPTGPPILALHGAMISSETWVCQRETEKNLCLKLVEEGYDVWLANRRGSKYSQKHILFKAYETRFWDFSLDEMIMHDLPAQVEYILGFTGHKTLSLMGFSQGSAESLGALAFSKRFHKRINCLIGLSTAAVPPIPRNGLIISMCRWSTELLFLVFGRKAMVSSVVFWQSMFSVRSMAWSTSLSMYLLFNWRGENLSEVDKPFLYRHLFSLASVKQIAHWFQIIRARRFQMYDDMQPGRAHIVPEYPLKNIRVPIIIFLGTLDNLADAEFLEENLPTAKIHHLTGYEHIDTLWARDIQKKLFPQAIDFLHVHSPLINLPSRPKRQINLENGRCPSFAL